MNQGKIVSTHYKRGEHSDSPTYEFAHYYENNDERWNAINEHVQQLTDWVESYDLSPEDVIVHKNLEPCVLYFANLDETTFVEIADLRFMPEELHFVDIH